MHQNIQNENDKLKEKLDETLVGFDESEKDRDDTKNENDRLQDEVNQQAQNISNMSIEIDKLKSGNKTKLSDNGKTPIQGNWKSRISSFKVHSASKKLTQSTSIS